MARIFISAGEASGEQYAVQLMAALRHRLPAADFYGLGGARMAAAGCRCVVRAEDVAVMGITEIVRHIPRIYREYRKLRRSLANPDKADAVVLIDFPDVNLGLAKRAKRLGIPVLFFVSPQVWAWKGYRLRRIRRDVNQMLVIFPFEQHWYRERGVAAAFVGHPLAELPLPTIPREEFARDHKLDPGKHWIGLLPGSRLHEIALNLPAMLGAAALLGPGYEYILPLAPTLTAAQQAHVHALVGNAAVTITRDARAALHHARAAVVASGTATVEAALIGNPFIVVYRLSRTSYAVARRFVKVPHVAMANLIAGRRAVPELIQDAFTPQSVAAALRPLIESTPERAAMLLSLAEIRQSLQQVETETGGMGAIEHVAEHVLRLLPASIKPKDTSPSLAL